MILEDDEGRYGAVEIEVRVAQQETVGALQAVKCRHRCAMESHRHFDEVRAMFVAESIADDIRHLCRRYGVECIEVGNEEQE